MHLQIVIGEKKLCEFGLFEMIVVVAKREKSCSFIVPGSISAEYTRLSLLRNGPRESGVRLPARELFFVNPGDS